MTPRDGSDSEAQHSSSSSNGYTTHNDRYRDSLDETEDDETIGPDAPLRRGSPNNEFDCLTRQAAPAWGWRETLAQHTPQRIKNAWAATKKWVKGP